jgi:uncharacterized protein YbjT (DUF2867 family)
MILVTGAAGVSGSAVVRELSRQKVSARALVRSKQKAAALGDLPGIELVEGDLSKPDTLLGPLDGVTHAMLISSSNPSMGETQCAFIDAAKRAGVAHVTKLSGLEIGFDITKFVFTRMHAEIEKYLEASGMKWTQLRPGQFMQVYLRDAKTIAATQTLPLPMGDVTMAPVDVEDLAKIAIAVMTRPGTEGRRFTITGPEALDMLAIAGHFSHVLNKPIRYVPLTPEQRREGMLKNGAPQWSADALFDQAVERLRNPRAAVDLSTHRLFSVEPTPFATFAAQNARAFLSP